MLRIKRKLSIVFVVIFIFNIFSGIFPEVVKAESSSDIVSFNDEKLENALKNILGIDASTSITSGDMANLPDTLNLSGKGITDLTGLNYAVNVSNLFLFSNNIKMIKAGTFNGLTNITNLGLNNNKIENIEPGSFDGLAKLMSLDLKENNISTLQSDVFTGLTSLIMLNVSNNYLYFTEGQPEQTAVNGIRMVTSTPQKNLTELIAMQSNRGEVSLTAEPALSLDAFINGTQKNIQLTPTARRNDVQITIGGQTVHSGEESANIHLSEGDNLLSVVASHANGDSTPYTLNIVLNAAEINSFKLEKLDPVASGEINHETQSISLNVPSNTNVTNLVPTIITSAGVSVAPQSGQAQDFTNPVTYTFTDEFGESIDYTVSVNKKSANTKLSDLTIDGATIAGFDPSTRAYNLTVQSNKIDIMIGATASDSKATVTGIGKQGLKVGDNLLDVIVTAEDGSISDKYTINVHKKSSDSSLSDLTVDGVTVKDFAVNTRTYNLDVGLDQASVMIGAVPGNSNATVSGVGEKTLNKGLNAFDIVVTAEDESHSYTYRININQINNQEVVFDDPNLASSLREKIGLEENEPITIDDMETLDGELDLSYRDITDVSPLRYAVHLTKLTLNHNNITTLEPDVFKGLTKLTELNLANNQIQTIKNGCFDGLDNLKTLSLAHNSIATIDTGNFTGLATLTALNLQENKLTIIKKGVLDGLNSLEELNIGTNPIASIETDAFKDLVNLQRLYCDYTYVKKIQAGIFNGLNNLKSLHLNASYQLTEIEKDSFKNMGQLTVIFLKYSKLTEIKNGAFNGLSNLTQFNLDNNKIQNIEPGSFSELGNLTYLCLANNQIERINKDTVQGLTNLTSLDLQSNEISTVAGDSFSACAKLSSVNLSDNYLYFANGQPEEEATQGVSYVNKSNQKNLAFLNDLTSSGCDISFDFDKKVYSTNSFAFEKSTDNVITVTATGLRDDVEINVEGHIIKSGETSPDIELVNGDNTIDIDVSHENGDTQNYTMNVNLELGVFYEFMLNQLDPVVNGEINHDNHTISLTVPYNTDMKNLMPTIYTFYDYHPVSVSPASGVVQDFTNPVNYTFTGQNGAERTYNVAVKQLSNECSLSDIKINGETIKEFNSNTKTYNLEVPYFTYNIDIAATTTDSNASVTGDGNKRLYNLGNNQFKLMVTGEDKQYTDTYTINIYRRSNDMTLSDLTVNGESIQPDEKIVYTYNATVGYDTESIDINPTPTDSNASVIGAGEKQLEVGDNCIQFTVQAEETSISQMYTVNVHRQNNDASLSDFKIDGETVDDFNANTKSYNLIVGNDHQKINLEATPTDSKSRVEGIGDKALNVGENSFDVIVKAEDRSITDTYTVNVYRKSNIATLSDLRIDGATIKDFDPLIKYYELNVSYDTQSIDISATTVDRHGKVEGVGQKAIKVGDNSFNIIVKAEDETISETYKVNIHRKNNITALSNITIDGETIEGFDAETKVYNIKRGYNLESVTIDATAADDHASVSGMGEQSLKIGDNSFKIIVTAEDTSIEESYIINIYNYDDVVVDFNDSNLEKALKEALNLSFDEPIKLSHMHSLEGELDLSRKKIKDITGLNTAINLTKLDLSFNKELNLTPNRFEGLENVQTLYLSSSGIATIEPGTFNGLENLKSLLLNENKMTNIDSGDFDGLVNLSFVNLIGNYIDFSEEIQELDQFENILIFKQPQMNLAEIDTLAVDKGNVQFNYGSNTYRVNLLDFNHTLENKIDVKAITHRSDVEIKINGNIINSGEELKDIRLSSEGLTTINIETSHQNGDKKTYTLEVNVDDAKIEAFNFKDIDPEIKGVINHTDHTIALRVPYHTDLSKLKPTITIPQGGKICPASGEDVDFRQSVIYTLTAENEGSMDYTVSVSKMNNNTQLSNLTIDGEKIKYFYATKKVYNVEVAYNVESVTIGATAWDSNAEITGLGKQPLEIGDNTLEVNVAAEDRSITDTYTINLYNRPNYPVEFKDKNLENALKDKLNIPENQPIMIRDMETLDGYLNLRYKEITDLTGLNYAVNIYSLDLEGNQLNNIKADDFKGMTKVTSLDLSDNKITRIEADSFKPFDRLYRLNLSENYLYFEEGEPEQEAIKGITEVSIESQKILELVSLESNRGELLRSTLVNGVNQYIRLTDFNNTTDRTMTFTPTAYRDDVEIKINGQLVKSGSPSEDILLSYGENLLKIEVSHRNGQSETTIVNAILQKSGIDSFVFDGMEEYVTKVNHEKQTVSLSIPFNHYFLYGFKLTPNIILSQGDTVTPSSGLEKDFSKPVNYTIKDAKGKSVTYTVSVGLMGNATHLTSLNVNGEIIKSDTKNHYKVNVPYAIEHVTIDAIPADEDATVTGEGEKALKVGDNTFYIKVIAEDQSKSETFTIDVFRNDSIVVEIPDKKLEAILREKLDIAAQYPISPDDLKRLDGKLDLKNGGIQDITGLKYAANVTSLDLSGNGITLQAGTFDGFEHLYTLTLENMNINAIEPGVFNGLNKLKTLNLDKNKISSISKNSFSGLENLKTLNLDKNKISQISKEGFNGLTSLEKLSLKSNEIVNIKLIDFTRLNHLKTLYLNTNKIESIEKESFKGLENLMTLDLSSGLFSTKISDIEEKSFENLTKLEDIYLNNNQLSVIEDETFKGLINLKTLAIRYNPIRTIESNSFNDLTKLYSLHLYGSDISHVNKETFSGLSNLTNLYFQNSHICHIAPETFSELTKLNYLNLSGNDIHSIEELCAGGLPANNIRYMFLNSNSISEIQSQTVKAFTNLAQLNLAGNSIGKIEADSFEGLTKLKAINLTGNYLDFTSGQPEQEAIKAIASVSTNSQKNFAELKNILASSGNTAFDFITSTFSINAIDFNNETNKTVSITPIAYREDTVIKVNGQVVKSGTPSQAIQLSEGFNVITIELNHRNGAAKSYKVNCTLSNTNPVVFKDSRLEQALRAELGMSSNQTITANDMANLQGTLNLRNMGITDATGLNYAINVRDILLDHNKISCIEKGAFNGLAHLESLHLQYNQISSIDKGSFEGLTRLDWLDLTDNQMTKIETGVFDSFIHLNYFFLNRNNISHVEAGSLNVQGRKLNPMIWENYLYSAKGSATYAELGRVTYADGGGQKNLATLEKLASNRGELTFDASTNTYEIDLEYANNTTDRIIKLTPTTYRQDVDIKVNGQRVPSGSLSGEIQLLKDSNMIIISTTHENGDSELYEVNVNLTPANKEVLLESLNNAANNNEGVNLPPDMLDKEIIKKATEKNKKLKVDLDTVTVEFPPNALKQDTLESGGEIAFKKTVVDESKVDELPDDDKAYKVLGKVYDFDLSLKEGDKEKDIGNEFKEGTTINVSIQLTEDDLKNCEDISTLTAYYYNEQTKEWEAIGGTFDEETMLFTFSVKHFSIYTVKGEPAKDSDSTLSNLAIDGVTVDGFDAEMKSYELVVENDEDTVLIEAIPSSEKATLEGTGMKRLVVGKNSFDVVVTAEDGRTRTYTTNIYRKDDNATLADISVDGETIDGFDSYNKVYNVLVENNKENLLIEAVPIDDESSVSGGGNKTLIVGDNRFEIQVTAKDSSTDQYIVHVHRKDNIATLSDLTIDGVTIKDFDSSRTIYNLTVEHDKEQILIDATATSNEATITGAGEKDLIVGDNSVEIDVTSEDGNVTEKYTVYIKREMSEEPDEEDEDSEESSDEKKEPSSEEKVEETEESTDNQSIKTILTAGTLPGEKLNQEKVPDKNVTQDESAQKEWLDEETQQKELSDEIAIEEETAEKASTENEWVKTKSPIKSARVVLLVLLLILSGAGACFIVKRKRTK